MCLLVGSIVGDSVVDLEMFFDSSFIFKVEEVIVVGYDHQSIIQVGIYFEGFELNDIHIFVHSLLLLIILKGIDLSFIFCLYNHVCIILLIHFKSESI